MSRLNIHRTGTTVVQWVVVAALIVCVIFASVTLFGTRTRNKLDQTKSDLANPANLPARFGS